MVRRRSDEGAALLIVIAFVFVLSLVIGAVASNADTGVRSTAALRDVRASNYALDAGVIGAIQSMRNDITQGVAPGFTNGNNLCNNYDAPAVNKVLVTVSCVGEQNVQGQFDSGGFTPTIDTANIPPVALQTAANLTEPGLVLDGNSTFRIHGSVQATSSIRACTNNNWTACSTGSSGTSLYVEGTVKAAQCFGDIKTFGPPYPAKPGDPPAPQDNSLMHCPGTPDAIPTYIPNFTPAQSATTPPTCPAGNVIRLSPGTYTSAAALTALTGGTCANKIIWFQPGNYFFNFPASDAAWQINDATDRIIGGTPFGWSPSTSRASDIPIASNANPAYHACVTDYDAVPAGTSDPYAMGVQFVFTGSSRVAVGTNGGSIELCANRAHPNSTDQEIALFGVPVRGNAATGELGATSVVTSQNMGSDIGTAGLTTDESFTVPASTPSGGSASVTYGGYNQLDSTTLPASAQITKVTLRVVHQEGPSNGFVSSVTARIAPADGSAPTNVAIPACVGATPCSDEPDVTSILSTVAKLRSSTGQGPQLSFTVAAASGKVATSSIDGIALDVFWLPPSLVATNATGTPVSAVTNASSGASIDATGTPPACSVAPATPTCASFSLASATATTASDTLTGFNSWPVPIPAGSQITSVIATVVHTESGQLLNSAPWGLTGTAADGTAISAAAQTTCATPAALCTTPVDLTNALSGSAKWTIARLVNGSGGGISLKFAVNLANGNGKTASGQLDGIRVDVSYTPPDGFGTASGCVAQAPYSRNSSSTCALVSARGAYAYVNIHGTVYAPGSAMDLKVVNGGTTVFGRGMVVRTLRLNFNPSVTYTGNNIAITVPSAGSQIQQDRVVDFWACLPLPTGARPATCDNSNARLHAVAEFVDGSGPGTSIQVRLWAQRR